MSSILFWPCSLTQFNSINWLTVCFQIHVTFLNLNCFVSESDYEYGFILDCNIENWREKIRTNKGTTSLIGLLQQVLQLKISALTEQTIATQAKSYNGDEIITGETDREDNRKQLMSRYRTLLFDTAQLILPASNNINYSFNPTNLIPLDQSATIYPTLRVVDKWEILEVSNGALLCRENGKISRVQVSATNQKHNNQTLEGNGWKLTLNPGWNIFPAERKGDLIVKRDK